jgi:hypothetical protein
MKNESRSEIILIITLLYGEEGVRICCAFLPASAKNLGQNHFHWVKLARFDFWPLVVGAGSLWRQEWKQHPPVHQLDILSTGW